jgi:copper chaperone
METLKFKTNINCGNCLARVTPILNGEETIDYWEVDLINPEKILTVQTLETTPDKVINTVKKAGFQIELLNQI